jgi:hypothetical protein
MSKMIINDKRNSKVVRELSEGDIFTFDNEYYIYIDDDDTYFGVNLQSGRRRRFRDIDKISLVRATLTIE